MYAPDRLQFPEPIQVPSAQGTLTPRTERHVRGRKCWMHLWLVVFVSLYFVALVLTQQSWCKDGLCLQSWWCVTRMYLCTFVAALSAVLYIWSAVGRDEGVPLGLLASIWFTAGTLSVSLCSVCNWCMVQLWAWMNPVCYITYPADNWPWAYTSQKCILINVVQWILTAGIIEESFKFVALLRLCPTPSKIQARLQSCRCKMPCLPGCLFRLADTPLAVALCGLAVGGGLATTENFMYIFSYDNRTKAFDESDFTAVYGRIGASFVHMAWTGYAACGLAKWQFMSPSNPWRPRRRTSYLLAPIVLHGLYNWLTTLQTCIPYEETYKGKLYKSDGCYLPFAWRVCCKIYQVGVVLFSFHLWHTEFTEIEECSKAAQAAVVESTANEVEARQLLGLQKNGGRAEYIKRLVWQF